MGAAENKKIVQTMIAELAEGHLRRYLEPMADDMRFTTIGTTNYSGTLTKAEYEKLLRSFPPMFKDRPPLLTPDNFIAEGDYVVAQMHGKSTTIDGKPYNNTYCFVYRFANGKIQEIMEYLDTELIANVFGR
jgi:ketosteroid isomerase-like protein